MDFIFALLIDLIRIYSWVLIIYIIMSWFPNARESSFGECWPHLRTVFGTVPQDHTADRNDRYIAADCIFCPASCSQQTPCVVQWF